MQNGKHIDFTGVTITDEDTGTYAITRVDPREHRCESCMEPAEYLLRSEWDMHGQCEVAQCQQCLREGNGSIFSPDSYAANS